MNGLYLSSNQITDGAATLKTVGSTKVLKVSQIDDIVSIWRKYLKNLAPNYPLRSTLESQVDDTEEHNRCAKLAACLLLWQDVQFDNSAFAATNANRTGFTDSTVAERFDIFEYTFGLFWDIPPSVSAQYSGQNTNFASTQTISRRIGK